MTLLEQSQGQCKLVTAVNKVIVKINDPLITNDKTLRGLFQKNR